VREDWVERSGEAEWSAQAIRRGDVRSLAWRAGRNVSQRLLSERVGPSGSSRRWGSGRRGVVQFLSAHVANAVGVLPVHHFRQPRGDGHGMEVAQWSPFQYLAGFLGKRTFSKNRSRITVVSDACIVCTWNPIIVWDGKAGRVFARSESRTTRSWRWVSRAQLGIARARTRAPPILRTTIQLLSINDTGRRPSPKARQRPRATFVRPDASGSSSWRIFRPCAFVP
jgi:hypothetical protein